MLANFFLLRLPQVIFNKINFHLRLRVNAREFFPLSSSSGDLQQNQFYLRLRANARGFFPSSSSSGDLQQNQFHLRLRVNAREFFSFFFVAMNESSVSETEKKNMSCTSKHFIKIME